MSDKKHNQNCNEHHHDHCGCGCEGHHDHANCNCGDHHDHCDCGCEEEDIVELTADDGRKLKFYLVGTIEFNGKEYSAFEPAEQIEGLTEDDLVIFEIGGEGEEAELIPIEDEALLDQVFQEFCKALEDDDALSEEEEIDG